MRRQYVPYCFSATRPGLVVIAALLTLSTMADAAWGTTPAVRSGVSVAVAGLPNDIGYKLEASRFSLNTTATRQTTDSKTQNNSRYDAIRVVVLIVDLYLDDSQENTRYIDATIASYLNRYVARYVLPPLRKKRFKVTYAGVKRTDSVSDKYNGLTLVIEYSESEGARYLSFNGVNIECGIFLYGTYGENEEPLWHAQLTASNDFEVKVNFSDPNGSFRRNALVDLKSQFEDWNLDFGEYKK